MVPVLVSYMFICHCLGYCSVPMCNDPSLGECFVPMCNDCCLLNNHNSPFQAARCETRGGLWWPTARAGWHAAASWHITRDPDTCHVMSRTRDAAQCHVSTHTDRGLTRPPAPSSLQVNINLTLQGVPEIMSLFWRVLASSHASTYVERILHWIIIAQQNLNKLNIKDGPSSHLKTAKTNNFCCRTYPVEVYLIDSPFKRVVTFTVDTFYWWSNNKLALSSN